MDRFVGDEAARRSVMWTGRTGASQTCMGCRTSTVRS